MGISLLQAAVLAYCVIISQTAPQHYIYYAPYTQPQHYGHYGGVSPVSYNPTTGYNAVNYNPLNYNPAISYNPTVSYSPAVSSSVPQDSVPQQVPAQGVPQQTPVQHVPAQHIPAQHIPQQIPQQGPSVQYFPPHQAPHFVSQNVPQYIPQQFPHQVYYNGLPNNRQPQFVFVYPSQGAGPVPGAIPSMPIPPPRDETGDAETIGEESEDREPLSPGVAMSGPEVGKRVMPEKHVAVPAKKEVQKVQTVMDAEPVKVEPEQVINQKAEVPGEEPEEPEAVPESPPQTDAPTEVEEKPKDKIEEKVELPTKKEVKRHSVLQSRMGTPAQANVRRAAESEERHLRAESRGWRRRLAPGLQSVYLDADDDEDDKKKAEAADSVVVGGDAPAGPSVASVKPAAIALAGPGGVASASPVGTAVVGPGGLAVAAPSATAVAGPSGGVPPGALGGGSASARSNMRLYQLLEALYAAPARRVAAVRTAPTAYSSAEQDDYYDQ